MKLIRFGVLLSISIAIVSCAAKTVPAMPPNREAYILAHPHGWIEITVGDTSVAPAPQDPKEPPKEPRPPAWCSLSVSLNRELILAESLYPQGERQPPYLVESGFRIPAQVGSGRLEIDYVGCRDTGEDRRSVRESIDLTIEEGFVTTIQFDGERIDLGPRAKNEAVTLEKLDERLNRIEHALKAR